MGLARGKPRRTCSTGISPTSSSPTRRDWTSFRWDSGTRTIRTSSGANTSGSRTVTRAWSTRWRETGPAFYGQCSAANSVPRGGDRSRGRRRRRGRYGDGDVPQRTRVRRGRGGGDRAPRRAETRRRGVRPAVSRRKALAVSNLGFGVLNKVVLLFPASSGATGTTRSGT